MKGCLLQEGLPRWCNGKESTCQWRRCRRLGCNLRVGKIPWTRKWQPTPVFLPGESHGQRSLEDYVESMGLQRVGHEWAHTRVYTHFREQAWCLEWFYTNDQSTQQLSLKQCPESRTIYPVTRGIQNCNLGLPVTPAGRDGPACRQGTEATKRNSTLSDKCQAQTFITLLLITKKKKKSELVTGCIMVPRQVQVLTPRTCECHHTWQWDLAGVITWRIRRWEGLT